MKRVFKTDNGIIYELENFETDVWVSLTAPNMEELLEVSGYYNVNISDLKAALDDEESSRVQLEDG